MSEFASSLTVDEAEEALDKARYHKAQAKFWRALSKKTNDSYCAHTAENHDRFQQAWMQEADALREASSAELSSSFGQISREPCMDKTLPFRAMHFARWAHAAQVRKYTGASYIEHLGEVAGIVASVASPELAGVMAAVSWLHDYIEDQREPEDVDGQGAYCNLVTLFGPEVANGVLLLSDLETGNRAQRKAAGRERLAKAPAWVQTIKCADLISNTSSIVAHDPKFAAVYLDEKEALLDVLVLADEGLRKIARQPVVRAINPAPASSIEFELP